MTGEYRFACRHDRGVFYRAPEVTDVSGPIVCTAEFEGFPGDSRRRPAAVLPGKLGKESLHEPRDVLFPLPQGGNPEEHGADPVIEFLPQFLRLG